MVESFKEKQLKKHLDLVIGDSDAGQEMKALILKANSGGFCEADMEAYRKQKEEDLKLILERFSLPNMETVDSKVIYNQPLPSEVFLSELIIKEADVEHGTTPSE